MYAAIDGEFIVEDPPFFIRTEGSSTEDILKTLTVKDSIKDMKEWIGFA